MTIWSKVAGVSARSAGGGPSSRSTSSSCTGSAQQPKERGPTASSTVDCPSDGAAASLTVLLTRSIPYSSSSLEAGGVEDGAGAEDVGSEVDRNLDSRAGPRAAVPAGSARRRERTRAA
jgi:hypothetical protein